MASRKRFSKDLGQENDDFPPTKKVIKEQTKQKSNEFESIIKKFNEQLEKMKPIYSCILCKRLLYPKEVSKIKNNLIHNNYSALINCKYFDLF